MSGYAIQQRTLRDLRVAIRPRESKPSPKAHLPAYFMRVTEVKEDGTVVVLESQADIDERTSKKYVLDAAVQVTETAPESVQDGPAEQAEAPVSSKGEATAEQLSILESIKAKAAQKAWGVSHPDPLAKVALPVSRAERRRLIKEEIQRLAVANKPVYYQRRLW